MTKNDSYILGISYPREILDKLELVESGYLEKNEFENKNGIILRIYDYSQITKISKR